MFSEVQAWLKDHLDTSPKPDPTQYFFTLTDIYFGSRGKLALAGFAADCGSLCGTYLWRVFEKSTSGEWQPRKWVNCIGAS